MSYYSKVYFDSVDLTTITNVKITDVITDKLPDTTISNMKLAKADGTRLFNKEYGSKSIIVQGLITANTKTDYLTARNTLLRYLQPIEVTLQFPYDDQPVEYTATLQNSIFKDTGGGYGAFDLEFVCSDPFGYDRDTRTILNGATNTSASANISLLETVGGYYKTPPYIILTCSMVTGGTGKYIDLTNEDGDNIRITRDWVSDDQLILDMKNKTCRVNATQVDYTGSFWDFNVGDTTITYTDNFTTRSVSILATYKRRRL